MKHLVYRHQSVPPMVVAWYRMIHGVIGRLLDSGTGRLKLSARRRRLVLVAGVVVSLVCQGISLWLAYQLVELSLDLMEVWTELAMWHFALTSVPAS